MDVFLLLKYIFSSVKQFRMFVHFNKNIVNLLWFQWTTPGCGRCFNIFIVIIYFNMFIVFTEVYLFWRVRLLSFVYQCCLVNLWWKYFLEQ